MAFNADRNSLNGISLLFLKHLRYLACRLAALKPVSILLRPAVPVPVASADLNQDLAAMTIADTAQGHCLKPFCLA